MRDLDSTIGGAKIIRELGRGSMGAVYLGERCEGWEQVAVKVIRPELASNAEIVQRFLAEARAVARVRHQHVVRLEDFGQQASGDCYIVMELIDGESLTALVKRHGRLPIDRALAIAGQVADGIAAAHDKGVIHRDLKPDNVMVTTREGRDFVKVLDFGLAKISGDTLAQVSHAGAILGTPHYMAPETARGSRSVDHRVDIYALGCILFELVTGSVVFPSDAFGEVLVRHVYDPPTAPSTLNPDIPMALERIILRALSKDPRERFVSMTEMAWALRHPQGAATCSSFIGEALSDLPQAELSHAPTLIAELTGSAAQAELTDASELDFPIEVTFPMASAPIEDPVAVAAVPRQSSRPVASERPRAAVTAPEVYYAAPIFTAAHDEVTRIERVRGFSPWEESDTTAYVPPLVAMQIMEEARDVRHQLRRFMVSAVTAVVLVVFAVALGLG